MNISHEYFSLVNKKLPCVHIVIPGKQLCDQAKTYINSWKTYGFSEAPTLGSILPSLIVNRYIHSHNFLFSYVEEDLPLSDINQRCSAEILNSKVLPSWYFENVCTMFLICSHFKPVQCLISYIRANCLTTRHIKVVELQHGWVVGKQSSLRYVGQNYPNSNPDYYLVHDQYSAQHLHDLFDPIQTIEIGDILFSLQLLRRFEKSSITNLRIPSNQEKTHNLLVCFSERDIELGYANKNFLMLSGNAFPRELIPLLKFLELSYGKVAIKMRSKPHQDQSKIKKGFSSVKSQSCISDDLLWADSVASALSTVSLSASYLQIPSYFYISNISQIHKALIDKYSSDIIHISSNTSLGELEAYSKSVENWVHANLLERNKKCLQYARMTIAKCYRFLDSILL